MFAGVAEALRSDQLEPLRQLIAWFRRWHPHVRLPPRIYLVPDTNCILKELDYACRRRQKPGCSALEEVVDAGLARLFAPMELGVEVEEKIPVLARITGLAPSVYANEWVRFRARIHFLDSGDSEPVAISDPDDACFVRAMRAVDADAIITDDLGILGAARSIRPPVVHHVIRTISRDEAVRLGLGVQGMLLVLLGGALLKEIGRVILRQPKIGLPVAGGALLALYLVDQRQRLDTGTSLVREGLKAFGDSVISLLELIAARQESLQQNLEKMDDEIGKRNDRGLEHVAVAVLLAAGKPVAEADIVSLVHLEGFDPWHANPRRHGESQAAWVERAWEDFAARIGGILRSDPRFVWSETGWTTKLVPGARAISNPSSSVPGSFLGPSDVEKSVAMRPRSGRSTKVDRDTRVAPSGQRLRGDRPRSRKGSAGRASKRNARTRK